MSYHILLLLWSHVSKAAIYKINQIHRDHRLQQFNIWIARQETFKLRLIHHNLFKGKIKCYYFAPILTLI